MLHLSYIKRFSILLLLLLLILITSCQKKSIDKKIDTTTYAIEDGGTLLISASSDVGDLNPLTYTTANAGEVIGQIFESLTKRDEKLTITPRLAESWEFSPDFLSITYKLRKGLLWSDGTPLTAKDVENSVKLFTHPDINSKDKITFEMIDKVEALDDYNVKFTFKEIYSEELDDSGLFSILPKHIMDKIKPKEMSKSFFSERPIGAGPFKLEKWDRGQQWILSANENFYKGRPHLDRILYRVIPDPHTRLTALKTGEIDLMESILPKDYESIKSEPHLNIITIPERGYTFIGWNLKNPLFQSKKVRQALTMAINREQIIERYLFNFGEVATVPVLKGLWAYNDKIKPYQYNIEKAKKMLAEEGWTDTDGDGWLDKNGKKFSFVIKYNVSNPIRENIALYMKEQFKSLGIEVIPHGMEWNTYTGDLFQRKFEACILAWNLGFTMNPKSLWHSETAKMENSNNIISYSNPVVDSLINVGRRTLDQKKAKLIWDQFQEIIHDDQPYTFLFTRLYIHAANKRLKGFEKIDIRGIYYNTDEWWIPLKERREGDRIIE